MDDTSLLVVEATYNCTFVITLISSNIYYIITHHTIPSLALITPQHITWLYEPNRRGESQYQAQHLSKLGGVLQDMTPHCAYFPLLRRHTGQHSGNRFSAAALPS